MSIASAVATLEVRGYKVRLKFGADLISQFMHWIEHFSCCVDARADAAIDGIGSVAVLHLLVDGAPVLPASDFVKSFLDARREGLCYFDSVGARAIDRNDYGIDPMRGVPGWKTALSKCPSSNDRSSARSRGRGQSRG